MAGAKPVVFSRLALRDVEDAIAHYRAEAGAAIAARWIDRLEAAVRTIGRQPGIGSPRHGQELQIPGLRSWRLHGFSELIFYVEQDDAVDVLRVLHGARDIARWLAE